MKIGSPTPGDDAREMAPHTDRGVGALFDAVDRGKRSVALDFSTDAGHEAFRRLATLRDAGVE